MTGLLPSEEEDAETGHERDDDEERRDQVCVSEDRKHDDAAFVRRRTPAGEVDQAIDPRIAGPSGRCHRTMFTGDTRVLRAFCRRSYRGACRTV
jgi:hypothetical protein